MPEIKISSLDKMIEEMIQHLSQFRDKIIPPELMYRTRYDQQQYITSVIMNVIFTAVVNTLRDIGEISG